MFTNGCPLIFRTSTVTRGAKANLKAIVFFNNSADTGIGRDIVATNFTNTFVSCFSRLGRNNYCDGNIDGIDGSVTNTNCKTLSVNTNTRSLRCNWMYGLVGGG
jgi:hypothetical protein